MTFLEKKFIKNLDLEYTDIILSLSDSPAKIARLQSELTALLALYNKEFSFTPCPFSLPIKGITAYYDPVKARLVSNPRMLVDHAVSVAFYKTIINLKEENEKDILFFLPETITKPFSASMTFKIISKKLREQLGKKYDNIDFVFISSFLGLVPVKYDNMFPATLKVANTEFTGILIKKLSGRIATYLQKTESQYNQRYALLRGVYREIMEKSIKKSKIDVQMIITEEIENILKKERYAWVKQGIRHKKVLGLLEKEFPTQLNNQKDLTDYKGA
ncbi:MAG: DUF5591 domain-containing protein [Methanosarcinales archaeon]